MAGLNQEIWIAELKRAFLPEFTFLKEGRDMSAYVDNNTINLAEAGSNPTVLKNNSSYPVAFSARTDSPLALPLATFDTEGTVVREAEKAELAYDKMGDVIQGHKDELLIRMYKEANYYWSPSSDAALTPIIETSGAVTSGFRKVKFADIAKAAERFDAQNIPQDGRVMVLDAQTMEDLRNEDIDRFNQLMSHAGNGAPGELYGFKVYRYNGNVLYTSANAKKAFGASYASTDKYERAFFFHKTEVMYAMGTLKMFERLNDPEAKGDIINFQQRFVALPIRSKAIGALITATS